MALLLSDACLLKKQNKTFQMNQLISGDLTSGSSVTEICHTYSAREEVRKHLHRNMEGMELEDISQCATNYHLLNHVITKLGQL